MTVLRVLWKWRLEGWWNGDEMWAQCVSVLSVWRTSPCRCPAHRQLWPEPAPTEPPSPAQLRTSPAVPSASASLDTHDPTHTHYRPSRNHWLFNNWDNLLTDCLAVLIIKSSFQVFKGTQKITLRTPFQWFAFASRKTFVLRYSTSRVLLSMLWKIIRII